MTKDLLALLSRGAMWLVWNVPLGGFAPRVFDFAMGQRGKPVKRQVSI